MYSKYLMLIKMIYDDNDVLRAVKYIHSMFVFYEWISIIKFMNFV